MSRIRTIKPEFWEDEKLGKVSRDARLLFVGLISLADDDGRLRANPTLIRAQVFPYDTKTDVSAWLEELSRARRIILYQADGESYAEIPKFNKHQKIDRPSPSKLPAPCEPSTSHREESRALDETSSTDQEGNGMEGKGSGMEGIVVPVLPTAVDRVFGYWSQRLSHPRAILDDKRRKLIRARLDEAEGGGATAEQAEEDLRRAVDGVLVDIASWPERRKFDGIEYVFENRGSVEKFLDLALKGAPKPVRDVTRGFQPSDDWSTVPYAEVAK